MRREQLLSNVRAQCMTRRSHAPCSWSGWCIRRRSCSLMFWSVARRPWLPAAQVMAGEERDAGDRYPLARAQTTDDRDAPARAGAYRRGAGSVGTLVPAGTSRGCGPFRFAPWPVAPVWPVENVGLSVAIVLSGFLLNCFVWRAPVLSASMESSAPKCCGTKRGRNSICGVSESSVSVWFGDRFRREFPDSCSWPVTLPPAQGLTVSGVR
jgi:hypothetical protein